jgi:NADH:ubiquinone oxidoreductase subunit 4 (subunit M)
MNGISSILFLNRLLFGEINLGTAHRVLDLKANGVFTHALIAAPLTAVGFAPVLLLRFLV